MTAFEIVQTILEFGIYTITLISLIYTIFKDNKK